MSPGSSRRRRRREVESDEDDDFRQSQAADSPKRRRLIPRSEDHEEVPGSRRRGAQVNGATDGSPSADFQPGAIVRVKVENFVTYEKAEFLPGPHLNMVIGPNGTGKSSLVCAICLGLGYSPKHLGRAGSVKEFVKHGKDTATIEIELKKRPTDRTNYTVRVQIRREQNSLKWWLNGEETNHKTIQGLMRKLKIQVDNLCQFLPQDRVVEFAACTPVDLLHETLRAAAPEEMLRWQSQLRDFHKDKKELAEASHNDEETLRNLESRQQGLQADVDRIREREEIQEQIYNLESAFVLAQYQEVRESYNQAKERKKVAERSLRRLEEESGPSLEAVNRKQAYAQQINAAISGRISALRDAEVSAERLAHDVSTASESVKELDEKLEGERKSCHGKRKALAELKSRITSLEADLKNRPMEQFNAGEFNQRVRAEEHRQRELEKERDDLSVLINDVKRKGISLTREIQKAQEDLQSFDTQQGQQLNFMKKQFPEVAAAWEWVQEHQNEFRQEVFGPPMITCSVKDERYSDLVQSLLSGDDFFCFTVQNTADYKKLSNQLYREMSLSVVIRTCANGLSTYSRPLGADETRALGLDGYAIDYLDGPQPVLAMLAQEKRLHASGVSLRDHNNEQYSRLVDGGQVNQWAAGNQLYQIRRRREYGAGAMMAIAKKFTAGRFWTSQPIDAQEKAELQRRFNELKAEKDALRVEYNELNSRSTAIENQREECFENIDKIKEEKNALQIEYQRWKSLPDKIESEKRSRETHEQALRDGRKSVNEIQYQWDAAVVRRAELVLRHKEVLERLCGAHQALLEAQIRSIEARSDIDGLKNRNASIMEQLDAVREGVRQATEESRRIRAEGQDLSNAVSHILNESPEKRDLLNELVQGKSTDDVRMEIEAEKSKLELIHAANPSIVHDFQRRAEQISKLREKMEGVNDKLAGLNREIDAVMAKWEPELEKLVATINDAFAYNFEQISCAGEVRIHRDEDFEAWALNIMVRFRENETLQQLNAHRQSGGERAVSTIFYLLGLQSLAQSPFRVVDEINQGMDPRNERMVHERMVEIACREHTSQYFLITPKLLTGLRYDPKMRILCIASGEHMPREGEKMDFRRCLRVQKQLMAAVG